MYINSRIIQTCDVIIKLTLVVHIEAQIIHTTKIVLGVARDNYACIGFLGKYSLSNLKFQLTLIKIK